MKRTVDPAEVARFRDLVRARTGITLPQSRSVDLERAILRAAADSGVPDAGALYELLLGRVHPGDPLDALVSALNVSETHFFRDSTQIQALEQRILPDLIGRRRPERRLRLWSAGCSTGEEAYTLAILMDRLLPDLAAWDVLILATDINRRSLERARRGVYGAWSFRGTPPPVVASYFRRCGERFEVAPRIRAMVTFARLNLAEDGYPSPATKTTAMDLVLCRNVLVYFDEAGGRAVVSRLRRALVDDGWLLVSQVEAGLRVFDRLTGDPGTAVYRKVHPGPATSERPSAEPAAVGAAAEPRSPAPMSPPPPPRQPPGRRPVQDPDDPVAAHEEAIRLWRAGFAEAALGRIEAVTGSRPLAAPLHYLAGLVLVDLERPDDAVAAFRRCTYADPEFALAHLALAGLFARKGLQGRARRALDAADRLLADLAPDAPFSQEDGLLAGDILELLATQRAVLASLDPGDASRG